MAYRFRLLALLLLALLAPAASAADATQWYKVEVIVFARPGAPLNSERWPVEIENSVTGRELSPWQGYTGPNSTPFQRLPAASLQMKREFEAMKSASEVEPILHLGWLQPGLPKEEAVAVRVAGRDDAGRVEGSLKLVLSRFLHLETNLIFHRPGDARETGIGPVYQLTESRRMRSREYHYLDHPLFGVVALVTPYE